MGRQGGRFGDHVRRKLSSSWEQSLTMPIPDGGEQVMCEDHAPTDQPAAQATAPSRRDVMNATAAVAAAGVVFRGFGPAAAAAAGRPARAIGADGTSAYSMAMHIHSSFSEQSGSMDSQLFQAAMNSVDVLWWTDHDHRMDGIDYRKVVHFTSLTDEKGGAGQGGAWTWTPVRSGPLSGSSTGGIVQDPCSPSDPVAGGSLNLVAKSTSTTSTAKYGYYANSEPAGWNYRDNLAGQSLTIDVLLSDGWTRGYLELLITTSYHEATGGRKAGNYALSYRFVPPGAQASRTRDGITGVITIPVSPASQGEWVTVTIYPPEDIEALWSDVDHRDFGLYELTLSAASSGDEVSGYFDYLRFKRKTSGEAFLQQQMSMESKLASKYPSVAQRQGLEVSWQLPHINWFGGDVVIPDYGDTTWKTWSKYLQTTAVPQIHAAGGLVSYNHPFGYSDPAQLPVSQQDALLAQVAKLLLPKAGSPAALGADLLEVGYPLRQGVNLAHHVALWDIMSRNGVFLTGNGTSDDHFGLDWAGIRNNWFTSTWASSTKEADLLAALAAGRVWCASLSRYRGSLDLLVDGVASMGSVSVSKASSRKLKATATKIPAHGSLQVLQGAVDYAGTSALAANTQVIAQYPAAKVAAGPIRLSVSNHDASFVRTQVLDSAGAVIALSNPVWLLRKAPPGGIPTARQA
jgi:hypothetical protein